MLITLQNWFLNIYKLIWQKDLQIESSGKSGVAWVWIAVGTLEQLQFTAGQIVAHGGHGGQAVIVISNYLTTKN